MSTEPTQPPGRRANLYAKLKAEIERLIEPHPNNYRCGIYSTTRAGGCQPL